MKRTVPSYEVWKWMVNRNAHCPHNKPFVAVTAVLSIGLRGFSSQIASNEELRCFHCCEPENAFEQIIFRVHGDLRNFNVHVTSL